MKQVDRDEYEHYKMPTEQHQNIWEAKGFIKKKDQ